MKSKTTAATTTMRRQWLTENFAIHKINASLIRNFSALCMKKEKKNESDFFVFFVLMMMIPNTMQINTEPIHFVCI